MADEPKLLQMLCTQLHTLLAVTVAQDKFGRSYFELTDIEKDQVEGLVGGMVRHYWPHYAPDRLLGMVVPPTDLKVQ